MTTNCKSELAAELMTYPTALLSSVAWPTHSSAEFRVPPFSGLAKVKGHFDRIDGCLEEGENGSRRLELIIDAASVNTGNRQRDQHLRGTGFFDAQRHPEVHFVSSQVSNAAGGDLRV